MIFQAVGLVRLIIAVVNVLSAIVVGGGNFLRGENFSQICKIPRNTADYMGMLATIINACVLQETLEKLGQPTRVLSASKILPDYIEIGIESYNPLEAKAGLDAVELRKKYGHKLGICGNSNIQVWETGGQPDMLIFIMRFHGHWLHVRADGRGLFCGGQARGYQGRWPL